MERADHTDAPPLTAHLAQYGAAGVRKVVPEIDGPESGETMGVGADELGVPHFGG